MSGGFFDYVQHRPNEPIEKLEKIIAENDSKELDEFGCVIGRGYCPEVIDKLESTVAIVKVAQVLLQRADWLISCDDGEESYLDRIEEDLSALEEA